MRKFIILRGLPGSGKTTYAKNYIINNENTIRINRYDLRKMLGCKWSRDFKNTVKNIEITIAKKAIVEGYNIIIDDTNISKSTVQMWEEIATSPMATEQDYEFVIIDFFDVDVKECIRRDYIREKSVGKEVINKMNEQLQEVLNKDEQSRN